MTDIFRGPFAPCPLFVGDTYEAWQNVRTFLSPRVLSLGNIWADIRGKRVVTTRRPGSQFLPTFKRIFTIGIPRGEPLSLGCSHRMWAAESLGLLTRDIRAAIMNYRGRGRNGERFVSILRNRVLCPEKMQPDDVTRVTGRWQCCS